MTEDATVPPRLTEVVITEEQKQVLLEDLADLIDRKVDEKLKLITGGLPGRLLTVDEVAEYLQCSRRFVYMLIAGGKLVPIKIGRSTRLSPDGVRAYVRRAAGGRRRR